MGAKGQVRTIAMKCGLIFRVEHFAIAFRFTYLSRSSRCVGYERFNLPREKTKDIGQQSRAWCPGFARVGG